MLDLMGLNRIAWVDALFRYSFIFSTALGSALSSAWLTLASISFNLAGDAKACSFSGLLDADDTLTAVTFVMNDSIGSTMSLVTAMMYDSHVTFSSFSRSFLLSTMLSATRMPLPTSWNTALLEDSVKRLISPTMMRRSWSRMCPKSRSFSVAANSASNGAICSRRMSRCLTMKSWPSMVPERRATAREACCTLAVVEATASCAMPPKMLLGRHRYTLDSTSRERCNGGYHSE
mmetsp:Transcript_45620/g.115328  ORF Transcript_45620/g.115328 Transcript_45620/m.115328 type:complete len:233 (-) Transcript_45620:777-1475(-)